ncbi:MAG: Rnf-Nqr domain containing protein [Gemmiger sp.]
MPSVNLETGLSLTQSLAQFAAFALLAIISENVVFSRALGISRLMKLLDDPGIKTWHYCWPVIVVQVLSAPLAWLAHNRFFPWLRPQLPDWLPVAALRPLVYLTCAAAAMLVTFLLLGLFPRAWRVPCREQLPLAGFNSCVLGTLLICANQNYTLLQSAGFGLGSGIGYVFAVFIVDEGRRRLRSKAVPTIFKGLPSSLIYIGILSMAIYALVGHAVAM